MAPSHYTAEGDAFGLADRRNAVPPTHVADLWPYCARSGLIERELARAIRAWALAAGPNGSPPRMTEAELNSHSQRQLVHMYLHEHILPTMQRSCPWMVIGDDA